jgi:hypothetical protein
MEVTPVVIEMGPVVGVAVTVAIAAAMKDARRTKTAAAEHGRGAKAATMDRNATASEPATMKRGTAASETSAVKSAAAETTASTTPAEAATTAAMLNLGRETIGCVFY